MLDSEDIEMLATAYDAPPADNAEPDATPIIVAPVITVISDDDDDDDDDDGGADYSDLAQRVTAIEVRLNTPPEPVLVVVEPEPEPEPDTETQSVDVIPSREHPFYRRRGE